CQNDMCHYYCPATDVERRLPVICSVTPSGRTWRIRHRIHIRDSGATGISSLEEMEARPPDCLAPPSPFHVILSNHGYDLTGQAACSSAQKQCNGHPTPSSSLILAQRHFL